MGNSAFLCPVTQLVLTLTAGQGVARPSGKSHLFYLEQGWVLFRLLFYLELLHKFGKEYHTEIIHSISCSCLIFLLSICSKGLCSCLNPSDFSATSAAVRFQSTALNLVRSGIRTLLLYAHLSLWRISPSALDHLLPTDYLTGSLQVQVFPPSQLYLVYTAKLGPKSSLPCSLWELRCRL